MSSKGMKLMITQPGLDMHPQGAKLLVRLLREAGFEVLYRCRRQTVAEIVDMAIRENINLLGLSCSSGAHRHFLAAIAKGLKENGAGNTKIFIFGGGALPPGDFEYLYSQGVKAIFLPSGSSLTPVLDWVQGEAAPQV